MSGYSTYTRWQRIEAMAATLGFRLGNPKHGQWGVGGDVDEVSLYPDGDSLPVYSRDTELFTGTFRDVEIFLSGYTRAQSYDMILRVTTPERRKRYEDRERARQAEQRKREEQKQMLEVLRASDAENKAGKKSK